MNGPLPNAFFKYMEGAEIINSLEEFQKKELGETYMSFKFNSATTIELTHYGGKPVLLSACSLPLSEDKPAEWQFQIKPISKVESYTETDKESGDMTRMILRVDDKFELLYELTYGQPMYGMSFDKGGFPNPNKKFEDVSDYFTTTAEV